MKSLTKLIVFLCLALSMLGFSASASAHDCSKDGHKLSEPISVKAATCSSEGYTGDIYCAFCGMKVVAGSSVAKLEHVPGELTDAREPSCSSEGYTGDIRCTLCRTVLTSGSYIETTAHQPGPRTDAFEATCSYSGYTGDIYCIVCGGLIEYGQSIPQLPHTPGDAQNVKEATCTERGYTGDIYCTVCNIQITEGEKTDMLPHVPGEIRDFIDVTCSYPGYTGDSECLVCGKTLYGEPVEKMTHEFDNGMCIHCSWLTPGLYVDGQMVFTWDQLTEAGYLEIKDNELRKVQEGLTGLLVVQEGLDARFECFKNGSLTGVYLPASVTSIRKDLFKRCENLTEVRCFGYMEYICENAFQGCTSLKSFVVPLGVTEIRGGAFKECTALESIVLGDTIELIDTNAFLGCTALASVELPASLKIIERSAFSDCTSLRELVLPEGLELIGADFITGSAISKLTLPSTVVTVYNQDNDELIKVDMSAAAMTSMNGNAFKGCANLIEVTLPANLEDMPVSSFGKCTSLRRLALPDGLKKISTRGDGTMKACTSLTELVWPVSLLDGGSLSSIPNLQTIYYRGTELQWNMTNTKDDYAGVQIVFEYTGD